MPSTIQIRRRIGSAGAPTTLAPGELGYNDPGGGSPDALYIGTLPAAVRALVSNQRQVEIAGVQTITGEKRISVGLFKLTGGADNDILTTDGSGNLAWTSAPSGGLLAVSVDPGGTLAGNGTSASPLSVVKLPTPRAISLQATGGTTITVTSANFDGTASAIMTGFEVTGLDCGTY